jgi:putative acetyltransferase
MELRQYRENDCGEIWRLFYDTVHTVNAKDYTQEQLNAWAPQNTNFLEWGNSRLRQDTIVAIECEKIIGFGSIITVTGYIDFLYVQKDSIGKGIGTAICDELEKCCQENEITTYASITARPFFEKRGFKAIRENKVERNGVIFRNYLMIKHKNEDE